MRRSLTVSILAVFVTCAAASATPGDPARLVSRDAVAYVQATSITALESSLRSIVGAIDAEQAQAIDIRAMLLADFGGDVAPDLIDVTKPIGFAVALSPQTMQPVLTMIVPARSADELVKALAASHQPGTVETDGEYVAWHSSAPAAPALASEPNPFAKGLPKGVLAARIDLAKVIQIYRPMIDAGLDQLEQALSATADAMPEQAIDFEAVFSMYLDGASSILDSAERFELALDMQGSRADLASWLSVAKGSVMDGWSSKEPTGVEKFAYLADPRAAYSAVIGLDLAAFLVKAKPMIDAMLQIYPEPVRALMAGYMKSADAVAKMIGRAQVMSGDLVNGEMRMTYAIATPDPAALIAEYDRMMKLPEVAAAGMQLEGPKDAEVAGKRVKQYRMKVSADALAKMTGTGTGPEAEAVQKTLQTMYGKDGLSVTLFGGNGLVAMVMGGDDAYLAAALARASGAPAAVPASMTASVAALAGQSPCMLARFDVGAITNAMQMMGTLLDGAPAPAPARPMPAFPIEIRSGIAGVVWSGGVSLDTGELGRFAKALQAIQLEQLNRSRAMVDIRTLQLAIEFYHLNNDGKYPDSLEVLIVLDENGSSYLGTTTLPVDPWGRAYLYTTDGQTYRVYSLGADGKPGGTGEATDIQQEQETATEDE